MSDPRSSEPQRKSEPSPPSPEPPGLTEVDKRKVRELLRPVIDELQPLLVDCARACRSGNLQLLNQARELLLQKFKAEKCHVSQVGSQEIGSDNPARLTYVAGRWSLIISENLLTYPSSSAVKELVHELGTLLMLKRLVETTSSSGEKLNLEDNNQLQQLKDSFFFESNPTIGITHVLDSLFLKMIKKT